MKKHILIALVCASLILITPFNVVAYENKISRNLTDKPDIKELISKIKGRINEKNEKYESIPKVADIWEIILYLLNLIVWILITIAQVILMIIIILLAIITFPIWFYLLLIFIMSS